MPTTPSEPEIFRRAFSRTLAGLWTALPGRVERYDATTRTADVLPVVRQPLGGWDETQIEHEELPVLPAVPVVFPAGGGTSIVWSLAPGDHVLLVFSTLDPGAWLRSGEVSDAGLTRRHSLSGGFALPGLQPLQAGLTDPGGIELEAPEIFVGAGATHPIARGDAVAAWLDAILSAIGPLGATVVPPPFFPTTADVRAPKGKVG